MLMIGSRARIHILSRSVSGFGILRARHRDPYILIRHGIRTTDQWRLEHDETATNSCAVCVHKLVYQFAFVHTPRHNGQPGCVSWCVGYIEPQTPAKEPAGSKIIHYTTIIKSDHQVETVEMTGTCT